jgi:hypothetical protein
MLQCLQLPLVALDSIAQALSTGASNPPPAPEVRRIIGHVTVPFCVNASPAGVALAVEMAAGAAAQVTAAADNPSSPWHDLGQNQAARHVLLILLQLLRMHVRYMLPSEQNTGGVSAEHSTDAHHWPEARDALLALKVRIGGILSRTQDAAANAALARVMTAATAANTALDAAHGALYLAHSILSAVQQRASATECASLISLIPAALTLTPSAGRAQAVSTLVAALLQMAINAPDAANGLLLPPPEQQQTASRIAWTALGAVLHDPLATADLSTAQAQCVIDEVALMALLTIQGTPSEAANTPHNDSVGTAARCMDLLSALNRAPTPAVAEAVALSAVVPTLIGAVLNAGKGSVSRSLLTVRNAPVAWAQKTALRLLYNIVFGALSSHTPRPAEPRVRAIKPMWDREVLRSVGSISNRGAVLAFS